MKAPDINDQEFPGLPGMAAKPVSDEAGEGEEGEDANGDADGAGEAGADGDDKAEKVSKGSSMVSTTCRCFLFAAVVFNMRWYGELDDRYACAASSV